MQANTAGKRNTPSTPICIHIKQPFADTNSALKIKLLMLKSYTQQHPSKSTPKHATFLADLYLAPLVASATQEIYFSRDSLMS